MIYIDWYSEKLKREQHIIKERQDNGKYWEDLVTGTSYFISDDDYDRAFAAGKKKLAELKAENNLKSIEAFFYQEEVTDEASLFPWLPYLDGQKNRNDGKCGRLCDYVCLRTACLYACRYDGIKNSTDPEEEKKKLRLLGFTWGFEKDGKRGQSAYGEPDPLLKQIDRLLSGVGKDIGEPAGCMADLVKGGTIKIKQYYLETNKIPEIRGASLLLERVNEEETKNLAKELHIRECLIYTGGGKMMGIFPEGTGQEFCRKMERKVEEITVTAQSNFLSRPYRLGELIHEYKRVVDEMDLALEERQNLRWDYRVDPGGTPDITDKELKKGWREITEPKKKETCTSCRNRGAVVQSYGSMEEKLCLSCFNKRLAGGREAKSSRHEDYKKYVTEKLKKPVPTDTKDYNRLEEIADSSDGFIGIIYGDANSMSSQINTLDSFLMMRYFSQVTSAAVQEIVFDALYANLRDRLSFEVIAVGGDDIFLIVPGKQAYDIACMIGEEFDVRFRNRSAGSNNITMSVGVCITHANMPVQYSFGIAQQLLKSAKKKAWKERQKNRITGTIDWQVIENEAAGCTDMEYQRGKTGDKPEKTLRPYTWSEAEAVKEFLYMLNGEKTFAFQMRQSWYRHTKEESGLFYEYQVARLEKQKIPCALKILSGELGGKAEKNLVVLGEKAYSPWPDAVELWDYIGDGKEMVEIEIKLTIRFYNSFFFGEGTGNGEIQSYLRRDAKGSPYIPGSALKGCMAEYAAALSRLTTGFMHYEEIFGTAGTRRGGMYFYNGTLKDREQDAGPEEKNTELRTGVRISRYTRAKKEGQLYTMETGGGSMEFQSSIYGFLKQENYEENIAHLVAAARMVYALGGRGSAGLGWLQEPIGCRVMKGEKGRTNGPTKQKEIKTETINQWIRNYLGKRDV